MIPAQTAQEAIPLAEQLESLGRRLQPTPDSPLAKLVSASHVPVYGTVIPVVEGESPGEEYVPDAPSIEAETRFPSPAHENLSEHDVLMDSMITDLAEQVGNHLTFAKNTVRPLIKDFVDAVSAQLSAYPDNGSYTPTVVRVDMPEVGLMSQIEGEAAKFKEGVYRPITSAISLPAIESSEVIALMKTGSAAMDAAIDLWVNEMGEGFFVNAYNVAFCASAQGVTDTPEAILRDKVSGSANLVALFLMARRLLENPPENSGYSLTDYRVAVGELVEQLGLRLSTAYEDRARNISQQNLLLASNKDTAWVCAPVYDQWIAEGKNVAVLFGNLLLDRPNVSVPAITQDAQLCLEMWERQNRFLTITLQNRKADAAKDTLNFCTLKLVGDNLEKCFGEVAGGQSLTMDTPIVAQALAEAKQYVMSLDNESLKDLWMVGTNIVAAKIFSYSCAMDILSGIDEAARNNPDIDPAEAALLSTVAYVSAYVVDQIELLDL